MGRRPGHHKPFDPGTRVGQLEILRREGSLNRYAAFRCRCDCGQEVLVASTELRRGTKKACNINGHTAAQKTIPGVTVSKLPEYRSWRNMQERCASNKHRSFPNYGGRGITVCDRWKSFSNFYEDMGKKPSPEHTLERKDSNGNYEPGNCKWATVSEQNRNQRITVRVTYEGKRVSLADLVDELGLSRSIVYARLKLGWPLDVALSLPKSTHYKAGALRKRNKKRS